MICFTVFYISIHKKDIPQEILLSRMLKISGAEPLTSEIYMWGSIQDRSYTTEDCEKIAIELCSRFDAIDGRFEKETYEDESLWKINFKGMTSSSEIINASVCFNKEKANPETGYVYISVTGNTDGRELYETRQDLLEIFKKYGINVRTNSCITGKFDGKLDKLEFTRVSKDMFEKISAKKVEGIEDGNLISVSAYSPSIDDYISINGNKVNLNLAIRYNEREDRTYIWIGTPVITSEY